jgi:hypothetical protein
MKLRSLLRRRGRPFASLTALGAVLLLGGVGCGDESGASEPDVILAPNTKVLDAATLARITALSPDRATLTLSGSTPQVDGLLPGDVIVAPVSAGTPTGLLRHVTTVDRSAPGGAVVITTGEAGLTDAFERAHITYHRELTTADGAPVKTASARPAAGSLHPLDGATASVGGAITLGVNNLVLFDVDGNEATKNDQVRMSGNVSIQPSLDLVIDIEAFTLKTATFTLSGAESASLDVTVDGAYTFDKSKVVPAYQFSSITIPVGGVPLVFVPDLRMRFGAKGALSVKAEMGATQTASFKAGVGYQNGSWGPIHESDFSAQLNPPQIDGKVSVKPYAGPELNLLLYGVAGPYVDLTGYLSLTADTKSNPCWAVHGGMDAKVGVKVELLGKNIASYDTEINLFDKEVASGASCSALPPDTFWSKTYGQTAATPEGASFVPTLDGGFVVVATSADLVTKLDAKGNVVWQHQFKNFHDVRSVVVLGDGTYAVAGSSSGGWLAKLDAAGAVLWSRRYTANAGAALQAATLLATKDGGFLLSGTTQATDGNLDMWVMKTDPNGTPLWSKAIGTDRAERAEAAREAADGHVIIVGTNADVQGQALSLATDGSVSWQRQYGGLATVQYLRSIAPAPQGGFLMAGNIQQGTGMHGWLVRIDGDGAMKNGAFGSVQYLPSNPAEDDFTQIEVNAISASQAGDDTYFGAGTLWAFRVGLGATGAANMAWSRSFDATGEDLGYAAGQLGDGTLLVAGTTQTLGSNPIGSLWFLRTQQNGALTFAKDSGVTVESLAGRIFQSSGMPDEQVAPVPVESSATSLASSDVPVTMVNDPLATIDTALVVRTLTP